MTFVCAGRQPGSHPEEVSNPLALTQQGWRRTLVCMLYGPNKAEVCGSLKLGHHLATWYIVFLLYPWPKPKTSKMKATTSSDNLRGLMRGYLGNVVSCSWEAGWGEKNNNNTKHPENTPWWYKINWGGIPFEKHSCVKSNWNKVALSFLVVLAWSLLVLSTLIGWNPYGRMSVMVKTANYTASTPHTAS